MPNFQGVVLSTESDITDLPLAACHRDQIGGRSAEEWQRLQGILAVTFRPGDHGNTFHEESFQPAGRAVAIVLTYGDQAIDMNISGYRARVEVDGRVTYGFRDDVEFSHRASLAPGRTSNRERINIDRFPSLVELTLRMDSACGRRLYTQLPSRPWLPRVILGFPAESPPLFEVTDALQHRAAEHLQVPLRHLTSNPPYLLERLLRDTWEGQLVSPDAIGNTTGFWLLDAEYCTQHAKAHRVFEDFRDLVGGLGVAAGTIGNDIVRFQGKRR